MKLSKLFLGLGIMGMSLNSFAQTTPTVSIDPTTSEVKLNDPHQLSPDLALKAEEFSSQVLNGAKQKLEQLTHAQADSSANIKIDEKDYEIARLALKHQISNSVSHYFTTLEIVNSEVSVFLTKVDVVKKLIDEKIANHDPRVSIYQAALDQLSFSEVPKVSASTNSKYKIALEQLMTLEGALQIPISGGNNQIKQEVHPELAGPGSLFAICKTYTCTKNLALDVQNWVEYSAQFNQALTFDQFPEQTEIRSSTLDTAPVITEAILDSANHLMDAALKANHEYTLASAIGAHLVKILAKVPAATALRIASVPTYIFEKTIRFIDKLFSDPVMRVSLNLNGIERYSNNIILKKLQASSEKVARKQERTLLLSNDPNTPELIRQANNDAAPFGIREEVIPPPPAPLPPQGSTPPALDIPNRCTGLSIGAVVLDARGNQATIKSLDPSTSMAQIEYNSKPGLLFWTVCTHLKSN